MYALVIDDSRAMRRIVASILERAGFDTVQAEHGQHALDLLAGMDPLPNLACIDWNMPIMDGLTFVNQVRRNPDYRDITLMMVTTESEQGRIVRALAAGAHEYVIKPFTEDALLSKLSMLGLVAEPVVTW